MPVVIDQNVLRFQISVYGVQIFVQVAESEQHLSRVEPRLCHIEPLLLFQIVEQLSSWHIVHHKIQRSFVLKRIPKIPLCFWIPQSDHKRMPTFHQHFSLRSRVLHSVPHIEVLLLQNFHRIKCSTRFFFH